MEVGGWFGGDGVRGGLVGVGPSRPRAYPARVASLARAPFAVRKGRFVWCCIRSGAVVVCCPFRGTKGARAERAGYARGREDAVVAPPPPLGDHKGSPLRGGGG